MPDYYAHSLDDKPPSDWQPLEEHRGKYRDRQNIGNTNFGISDNLQSKWRFNVFPIFETRQFKT